MVSLSYFNSTTLPSAAGKRLVQHMICKQLVGVVSLPIISIEKRVYISLPFKIAKFISTSLKICGITKG